MKITERIEMINGVDECYYDFDAMKLTVFYNKYRDVSYIKIMVADAIDKANVHRAIETIDFYSLEDN